MINVKGYVRKQGNRSVRVKAYDRKGTQKTTKKISTTFKERPFLYGGKIIKKYRSGGVINTLAVWNTKGKKFYMVEDQFSATTYNKYKDALKHYNTNKKIDDEMSKHGN